MPDQCQWEPVAPGTMVCRVDHRHPPVTDRVAEVVDGALKRIQDRERQD